MKMYNIIDKLIDQTISRTIQWNSTPSPDTFSTELDGNAYTLRYTLNNPEKDIFIQWTEDGEKGESISFSESLSTKEKLTSLFFNILKTSEELNIIYNNYINMELKKKNVSVSLYKVMKRLGFESQESRPYIHLDKSDYFYIKKENDPLYVEPPMSQLPTSVGMTPFNEAEIVMISAPGATGKTAMTNYLSNKLDIPILNLGTFGPVGASSVSGIIMHEIEQEDAFKYYGGIKDGNCSMIIDGLDEGAIKVNENGMEAFLKDVAFFAKGAKGLAFVMLGRSNVMDSAILYLEDLGVKICYLQIEPFTMDKAKQFIDNHVVYDNRTRHLSQYKAVRDYIIDQINGFFKDESDMNKKIFEHFIGYAPVLISISTLLNDKLDYHKLLDDLNTSKKQNIHLLLDIVERIIKREKNKIIDEVLEPMFDINRPQNFQDKVRDKAGSNVEQCARILEFCLNKTYFEPISEDPKFNEQYNEKITEWIKGHPFLDKDKKTIFNSVFECYVVASLININQYKEDVITYLRRNHTSSYLLLDIYFTIHGNNNKKIDYRFFPFLYNSFKSLDLPQDIGAVEIYSLNDDDCEQKNKVKCSLSFYRDNIDSEYEFIFDIDKNDTFSMPSLLSNVNVDAPLNIKTNDKKTEFVAPVTIRCGKMELCSEDVVITQPIKTPVIIECQKFKGLCINGSLPLITKHSLTKNAMLIMTDDRVDYPFNEFIAPLIKENRKNFNYEKYIKLRRMILMFRSHSKGVLARVCSKIDNRIGKSPMGKSLIDNLLNSGVLSTNHVMYFINPDKQAEVLGLKYDEIRSCVINEKIINFLQKVKDN